MFGSSSSSPVVRQKCLDRRKDVGRPNPVWIHLGISGHPPWARSCKQDMGQTRWLLGFLRYFLGLRTPEKLFASRTHGCVFNNISYYGVLKYARMSMKSASTEQEWRMERGFSKELIVQCMHVLKVSRLLYFCVWYQHHPDLVLRFNRNPCGACVCLFSHVKSEATNNIDFHNIGVE